MPILDIKNQFLDLSKLEINTDAKILKIINCEITNIELLAAKFPRVSYLTIHSNNVIIMNLDYILSYDLNYVNFNKNVLLLLKD